MLVVESPLIKELLQERDREISHAMIVAILRAKFPETPEDVFVKVRSIQDVERLEQLGVQAGVCTDLESFRSRLAA